MDDSDVVLGFPLKERVQMTKTQKKFVRRFATVFLPQESAVFYPDGNSPRKHHGK
jgi:hypothetical protein